MGISNGNQCGSMEFKLGVAIYYRKGVLKIRGVVIFFHQMRGVVILFLLLWTPFYPPLPITIYIMSSRYPPLHLKRWEDTVPHTCRQVGGGLQIFTCRKRGL